MTHALDHYAVLGLGRLASPADVDRAYRRAARATHPDVHPDDASAADRFRAATLAYETLRDPERRASYDRRQPHGRRGVDVRIVVHRPPSVAPVPVGRRPPGPIRTGDLIHLVDAFTRIVGGWRGVHYP